MISELELIGRARPLAAIRSALERMQGGHGGLLLIRGEPGIGKSALAARAASEAAQQGARVISGRPAWVDPVPGRGADDACGVGRAALLRRAG